nr:larval cuticle protein LCP-30-like [Leptinotarsa decemlineata]
MKVLIPVTIIFCVFTCRAEDDGQYHPDDEGQYIPDYSGRYIPDNSGAYRDDGTGRFSNDGKGQYQNLIDKFKYQNQFNARGNAGSASTIKSNYIRPTANKIPVPSTAKYDDGRWRIIRLATDVNTDGLHWEYETENEITGEENTKVHNKGTKEEIIRTQGFYKYKGPDNNVYNIEYTADENGFIPRGKHLPQSLQNVITLNRNS